MDAENKDKEAVDKMLAKSIATSKRKDSESFDDFMESSDFVKAVPEFGYPYQLPDRETLESYMIPQVEKEVEEYFQDVKQYLNKTGCTITPYIKKFRSWYHKFRGIWLYTPKGIFLRPDVYPQTQRSQALPWDPGKYWVRDIKEQSDAIGSRNVVQFLAHEKVPQSVLNLFSEQYPWGAQAVGMGKEAQSVPAAAELYKKANDILGFDLLDVCTNGPKEKLDSTVISQPAIYVTSLAAVELLRARDGGQQIIDSVDVTCGLSLGEYTALAFSEAFSFEDGLKLVKLRGEAMQEAADAAKSAMVSVIGLDSDKVLQLCDAANAEVDEANKVQIANFLCPGNYAVSGGVKGIEAVEAKAKSFKARMTVRLAVAGAFHTSFMHPAVSRLEAALAATHIRTPRIPVISNVDAQPHADPDTIKKILARQVTSPVQWETTVKTLLTKGLKKSYELGPGKVIAGIVKRIDKSADIENISA